MSNTVITILIVLSLMTILISEGRKNNSKKGLFPFILISVFVVLLTGVYSWLIKVDNLDKLAYLHNPDWSEHYSFPQITSTYNTLQVDNKENLHIVWLDHIQQTSLISLKHMVANSLGEMIHKPKTILKNKRLQQVSAEISNNELHIFWIGQGDFQKMDLNYSRVDLTGQIIEQKKILTDQFSHNTTDLKLTSVANNFMIGWIEKEDSHLQAKYLLLDFSGQIIKGPIALSNPNYNSSHLSLIHDQKQQFHFLWTTKTYSKDSKLYYQSIDHKGDPISAPRLLDQGLIQLNAMTYYKNKLYLTWTKAIHNQVGFKTIYGTIMDLEKPEQGLKINNLIKPESYATSPSLAINSSGHIYLTYIEQRPNSSSSIAYQIFDDNFVPIKEKSKWVFPKNLYAQESHLVADLKGNLHLYWFDSLSLQYTNNIHTSKITPLEIIGLPRINFSNGLIQNIIMIFGAPFIDLIIAIILIVNVILLGIVSYVLARFQKYMMLNKKIDPFKNNLYLVTSLICLIQIGIASVILPAIEYTMLEKTLIDHFWFIIPICLTCNILYIAINRLRKEEFIFGTGVSIAWLYWILLAVKTLNLPIVNFAPLPIL